MRKSLDMSDDGFLNRLPGGVQSSYVRETINNHLNRCRDARAVLAAGYADTDPDPDARSDAKICTLIRAAKIPASRYHETGLDALAPEARAALDVLWHAVEITALGPEELLEALDSDAHA
jgi:hypothetical protein